VVGETRQTRAGASRDTKTKGKEVINNAFANLYSASDASSSEEEEEEEYTIEVALGAPKAKKVQPRTPSGSQRQKQK
jgi:hypothetical protein